MRMTYLHREDHHHLHLDQEEEFLHSQVGLLEFVEHHTLLNIVFLFLNYSHPGRSVPPPPGRGAPPLPGDGVVTLDSWRKSQVLTWKYLEVKKPY